MKGSVCQPGEKIGTQERQCSFNLPVQLLIMLFPVLAHADQTAHFFEGGGQIACGSRLQEIIVHMDMDGSSCIRSFIKTGKQDDSCQWAFFFQSLRKGQPIHSLHFNICNDDIGLQQA